MDEFLKNYDFFNQLLGKRVLNVQSCVPDKYGEVASDCIFNFSDGSQLVANSWYEDNVDLFFENDEDAQMSIYMSSGQTGWAKEGVPPTIFPVHEDIQDIELIFDEVRYEDSKVSDKVLFYAVGIIVKTSTRSMGAFRENFTGAIQSGNYRNASYDDIPFSLEAKWGDWIVPDSYICVRHAKKFKSGDLIELDKQLFRRP